ncbi:MAG: hypothetical protein NC118_01355 [Eubacterium sp.]|nr:hypothetical protein [Eubacterium sp.]
MDKIIYGKRYDTTEKKIAKSLGVSEIKEKTNINLEQFVMPATERGQYADDFVEVIS